MALDSLGEEARAELLSQTRAAADASLPAAAARRIFDSAQLAAVAAMEAQCYEPFLRSDHFSYILELKAKEGIVPGLPDFKLQRVLGQGGFGQVLEVVKRDCGKHYAMKIMKKRELISAFQDSEFLVLVMDACPGGDLSCFALTKERLTP